MDLRFRAFLTLLLTTLGPTSCLQAVPVEQPTQEPTGPIADQRLTGTLFSHRFTAVVAVRRTGEDVRLYDFDTTCEKLTPANTNFLLVNYIDSNWRTGYAAEAPGARSLVAWTSADETGLAVEQFADDARFVVTDAGTKTKEGLLSLWARFGSDSIEGHVPVLNCDPVDD